MSALPESIGRNYGHEDKIPPGVRIPVAASNPGSAPEVEHIIDKLAEFRDDPLGFVCWAFPWGVPGTPLEKYKGPEKWQRDQLDRIGRALRAGGDAGCIIKENISAGHGVGKSAQVAWLCLWAVSTCEGTRGTVTANTEKQLKTKTWAELSTWYKLFIAKEFLTLTATTLSINGDREQVMDWRIDQIPWSKENPEAVAGMHNQGKRLLVIFDEASAIADEVFETGEGAMTDANTQIIWCRYGNGTRTTGYFYKDCTTPKGGNVHHAVDSRDVSHTNKQQIQAWVDEYGEDSDFVRVRVRGMFPRAGYSNFISPELVSHARRRHLQRETYATYPKVLAVDPARFGDDSSVITLRQGLKVHYQVKMGGFDGVELANRVAEIVRKEGAVSCIVYDAIGIGASLDDTLRRIPGLAIPLIPVAWGQPAKDDKQYFNQRAECWGKMKEWLENGCIPDDEQLDRQLTSLDYGYDGRFRIQLQSKKDLKKDGKESPDCADSLALTFIPELIDRKITIAKARPTRRRTVVWSKT